MRIRLVLATLTLAVVAEACISDSVVAPTPIDTLDAALADVALPALDYASATFSGAGVVTPTIVASRCQLDGASQTFICGALSGGGLTLNQHYTLLDAGGGKQSSYDMTTTSGLVVNSAVTGTATGTGVTLTVDGQQELVLSGLGTAQHTLNGSSLTMTTFSRVDGTEQPVTSRITTRIVDLVIPVVPPGGPAPWPASGMIELRTTTDLGFVIPLDPASTVSTAAMAFNGSSVVTLTITTQNGTQSCRVDIATTMLGC
jgi:hypothetical protein